MGHERIGFIPKTKHWQSIVAQLQDYDGDKAAVDTLSLDGYKVYFRDQLRNKEIRQIIEDVLA